MAGFRWFLLLTLSLSCIKAFELELEPSEVELKNKKTGDNILVQCRVTGVDSSQTISMEWWSASGDRVPPIGHVSSSKNGQSILLKILGAKKSDEGQYECRVSVDGVEQTTKAVIQLFEQIAFRDAPEEQHPEANKMAEIRCFVDPPEVKVVWLKDNKLLADATDRKYEFSQDNMVLRIPDFTPEKDDGQYVCQVVHMAAGSFDERIIKVSGHVAPTATLVGNATVTGKEGQNLKLRCGGIGRPQPELLWYKGTAEGELLKASDKYSIPEPGHLIIQSLTNNDAGPYTCVAKNVVSTGSQTATVNIFLRARIEPMQNVTVNVEEDVVIGCKYSGDGDVNAYWTFRGEILTQDPSTTPSTNVGGVEPIPVETRRFFVSTGPNTLNLNIRDIQMSDADEYQCEASNAAGADRKRVFLSVTHAPTFISFTDKTVRSFKVSNDEDVGKNRVSFFCEVEAVPAPTWVWQKPNGEELSADFKTYTIMNENGNLKSTVTLIPNDDGDYGQYICIATNPVGSETATINVVQVVTPPQPEDLFSEKSHPSFANVTIGSYDKLEESYQPTEVVFMFMTEDKLVENDNQWPSSAVKVPLTYESDNWYKIPGLSPETDYVIKVMAKNEAGETGWSDEMPYQTSTAKPPAPPVFIRKTDGIHELCDDECSIEWTEPESNGAEITGYRLVYRRTEFVDGDPKEVGESFTIDSIAPHRREIMLYDLEKKSYYSLKLFAINEKGVSKPGSVYVETGELDGVSRGMAAGSIVVIVIVILLIILAIVDVGCYFQNQCGLLMCFCVNCLGKTPPEVKEKEIAMEEGMTSDDKTPLREKEPEDKDTEATPMVPKETNGVHSSGPRATQV